MNFFRRKTANAPTLDLGIKVVSEQQSAQCEVSLSGRLTTDSSPSLRTLLLLHVQSPACNRLTVDFCDVAYIDTSGLAILVEVLKATRSQGKAFQLSGLRERPRYLLEATRLLKLFDAVNDDEPGAKFSQPETR